MKHLSLIVAVALGLAACSSYRADRTQQFQVGHIPGSTLDVQTRNGQIKVAAVEDAEGVTIQARIVCAGSTQREANERLEATTLDVSRDENDNLILRPNFAGGAKSGDGIGLTIEVPDAHDADLRTTNGRITVSDISGQLFAHTSNGRIEVTRHDGSADLDTSNGRVTATGITGDLRIDTSNGSVVVNDVAGPVAVDTSNGSISVKMRPGHTGPVNLDSSNGSIALHVDGACEATFMLNTSNGRLTIEDTGGHITSQTISRNRGTIRIGEGKAANSRLDTSNGSIKLIVE